jgi:hypothetical protein
MRLRITIIHSLQHRIGCGIMHIVVVALIDQVLSPIKAVLVHNFCRRLGRDGHVGSVLIKYFWKMNNVEGMVLLRMLTN